MYNIYTGAIPGTRCFDGPGGARLTAVAFSGGT